MIALKTMLLLIVLAILFVLGTLSFLKKNRV